MAISNTAHLGQTFGGLILAGGKSVRMGEDKAALVYRGRPLIEHMEKLLVVAGANPVLNVGHPGGLVDPIQGCGPAAGLFALLDFVQEHDLCGPWLVVPVDMPLLTPSMLRRLVQCDTLAAHYADETLPLMVRMDDEGIRRLSRVRELLDGAKGLSLWHILRNLNASALSAAAAEAGGLVNVNTPSDWMAVQEFHSKT